MIKEMNRSVASKVVGQWFKKCVQRNSNNASMDDNQHEQLKRAMLCLGADDFSKVQQVSLKGRTGFMILEEKETRVDQSKAMVYMC